jgi:hypothetical protein
MRLLLATGAASVALLGAGAAVASPAQALPTTDAMICMAGYTFSNGVCILPDAALGQQYEQFLLTADADGGYFTVTGTIPPGMVVPSSYGAAGTILGSNTGPTQLGTFTFTVQGTDNLGIPIAPMTYQVTVVTQLPPPPLQIEGPNGPAPSGVLPDGTVGTLYTQKIFVFGGVQPYAFAVIAGQLPPGIKLTSPDGPALANDQLTGTPTNAGTFAFTMQVTDARGSTSAEQFSLTIQPGPPPPPPSGGGGGGGGGQQ